jgi:hypothetical protein
MQDPGRVTLTDPVRRFVRAPRAAALATVGTDGAPHQTFIWYALEPGDVVLVNSLVGRRWPGELRRTGRAAMAIANPRNELSWVGLGLRVMEIDENRERALDDILALAHRYMKHPTEAYLDSFRTQQRITFRLAITAFHDHLREPD